MPVVSTFVVNLPGGPGWRLYYPFSRFSFTLYMDERYGYFDRIQKKQKKKVKNSPLRQKMIEQ